MAAALLAALVLAQSPTGTYRTGPVLPPPAPYQTRPAPAPASLQAWPSAPSASAQGYSISPDALRLRPRLRPTGVTIDNYDRRVEGYRAPEDAAYEATVLGGAAAVQGRQGPLDGAWELATDAGQSLYAFQIVQGPDGQPPEGAWSNLPATPAVRSSGFLLVAQEPGRVILRFFEPNGSAPIAVTLTPALDGSWRGQMVRAQASSAVVMRRR